MTAIPLNARLFTDGFFDGARRRIRDLQTDDGAIHWYDAGVFDPWNHVEAAMALTVLKDDAGARRAYACLAERQLPDGSWWGEYGGAVPLDDTTAVAAPDPDKPKIRDTNFAAYCAVGVLHSALCTGGRRFAQNYWPMVDKAISFVLSLQTEYGDIRWAARDPQTPEDDSLRAGCSAIYKSLDCALALAALVGEERPGWADARIRLGAALRDRPERFDRTWPSKAGFSMDWYYPALSGALSGPQAHGRIAEGWARFVVPGHGCRCVEDQPWVTAAETAELALTLVSLGRRTAAEEMLQSAFACRAEDGAFWMGYQYAERVYWPAEKPAWTAAAVILAADALTGASPASEVLVRPQGGVEANPGPGPKAP